MTFPISSVSDQSIIYINYVSSSDTDDDFYNDDDDDYSQSVTEDYEEADDSLKEASVSRASVLDRPLSPEIVAVSKTSLSDSESDESTYAVGVNHTTSNDSGYGSVAPGTAGVTVSYTVYRPADGDPEYPQFGHPGMELRFIPEPPPPKGLLERCEDAVDSCCSCGGPEEIVDTRPVSVAFQVDDVTTLHVMQGDHVTGGSLCDKIRDLQRRHAFY